MDDKELTTRYVQAIYERDAVKMVSARNDLYRRLGANTRQRLCDEFIQDNPRLIRAWKRLDESMRRNRSNE